MAAETPGIVTGLSRFATGTTLPSEPAGDITAALTAFLAAANVRSSLFTPTVAQFTPRTTGKAVDRRDVLGFHSLEEAMIWYAGANQPGGVIRALELGANIHTEDDFVLKWAVSKNDLNMVRYLLDERDGEKANIHAEFDYALRRAADKGHLPVVRYLLQERVGEKADIHAANDDALSCAARNGHLPVVRYLLDERVGEKANIHADKDHALRRAAREGHLPVVRYLLDERVGEKANIHAWDDDALRGAAAGGHLPVVRFLLEERNGEKADIHAQNDIALGCAAWHSGSRSVVHYLISKGAKVEVLSLGWRAWYGV